jgi:molecular chaperone GrpE
MDDINNTKRDGSSIPPDHDIDDVVIESYNDDDSAEGGGSGLSPQAKIAKLREELKTCKAERQEYLDGWQRTKADFANLKKRSEDEVSEFRKFAREEMIQDLLPVLESFAMAMGNKEAWQKVESNWRTGVEYIHTQLLNALAANGLTEDIPQGKPFDPNEHTAIGTIETDDSTKYHTVAEVVQPGYRLNGKLIRSPRVKVYDEKNGKGE